jgi:hypothetical protein
MLYSLIGAKLVGGRETYGWTHELDTKNHLGRGLVEGGGEREIATVAYLCGSEFKSVMRVAYLYAMQLQC